MKVEQLRVGNIINPKSNAVVSAWELYQMSIRRNTGETEKNEPIPLDEEWLLKFGFVKEKGMLHGLDKFKLFLPCINKPLLTYSQGSISVSNGSFSIEMKYVHQLQNLYYALTGEELTLNEI